MKTEIKIMKKMEEMSQKIEELREMVLALTMQKAHSSATFTHKEAAIYLNVSSQTLYNLVNQGKILKIERCGKKNIYSEIELNKYKYGSY